MVAGKSFSPWILANESPELMVEHCSGTVVLYPFDEAPLGQPHEILKVDSGDGRPVGDFFRRLGVEC